ncbi:hypothetical protein OHC33_003066 [Knufia fluminis]|uniref:Uncharacterized protein n=1 Tax=Knufia fluminis TaxID=191047 RepID=A0AAN8EH42_9EURO|nr:hypothetical protein OHC33_003066 [Knufia fluminis]
MPLNAHAFSTSQDTPTHFQLPSQRKRSITRLDGLRKIAQQATLRKGSSNRQEQPRRVSSVSIQNLTNPHRWSRKFSNTPFPPVVESAEMEDATARSPFSNRSWSQRASGIEGSFDTPLPTANLLPGNNRGSSNVVSESFRLPSIAEDGTSKATALPRPSIIRLEGERYINKRIPGEINGLETELSKAFFTVEAGATIGHSILLYYQGRGTEMLENLTKLTLLAQEKGNGAIMFRAQLWKAIILHEAGAVQDMPNLLGDIIHLVLCEGRSYDADFYQLRKLWSQYREQVIDCLANENLQQLGGDNSKVDLAESDRRFRERLADITKILDEGFDHSEWPDPDVAMNASLIRRGHQFMRRLSDLSIETQRLQETNERLKRENELLTMDNIRYSEERKTVPHLSTALSKDGFFPRIGANRPHTTDIERDAVSPGPVSALMNHLGHEPRHQLPGSYDTASAGPTRQRLAQHHAQRPSSSPFDQSPGRQRWGSSESTRKAYGRKHSSGSSFSPGGQWRSRRSYSRTPSWGSSHNSSRFLRARTLDRGLSTRSALGRDSNAPKQPVVPKDPKLLVPASSSAPALKEFDLVMRASTPGLSEVMSGIGTTSAVSLQQRRQSSINLSPHTRPLPLAQLEGRDSFSDSFDFAVDYPSARPKPLDTSARHSRKQSLPMPSNALDPESLPFTDTPSPTKLEANMPQLHENQERRRRSMSFSSRSPTSASSTSYEHERRRSMLQQTQLRGGFEGGREGSEKMSSAEEGPSKSSVNAAPPARQKDSGESARVSTSAVREGSRNRNSDRDESTVRETAPGSAGLSESPDVTATDSDSASMDTSSGSSISLRSFDSKPLATSDNGPSKSKRKSVTIGTGAAPLTPGKSPPSSAVSMPSTKRSNNNGNPSSDLHNWAGLSALAPEFKPRKPTRPEALRPRRISEDISPDLHQDLAATTQNQSPYSNPPAAHGGSTASSKDVRISLLLSQLETDQAATLDRIRRSSKPTISSPLRRSSRVSDDDDNEALIHPARVPSSTDWVAARDSVTHNDPGRAPSSPSDRDLTLSLHGEHKLDGSSGTHEDKDDAAQIDQAEDQFGRARTAQGPTDSLGEIPNLKDRQRFFGSEDWRNIRDKFPSESSSQGTNPNTVSKEKRRTSSNVRRKPASSISRAKRRNKSMGLVEKSELHPSSQASTQNDLVGRELPSVYRERWKHLSVEQREEAARGSKSREESILNESSQKEGHIGESRTEYETPDLYGGSNDGKQDTEASDAARTEKGMQSQISGEAPRVETSKAAPQPHHTKRHHSIYDEIENSYPSPTSPQSLHDQVFSQEGVHGSAQVKDDHSLRGDASISQQEHNDSPSGTSSSNRDSEYSRGYSFSGFSDVYSPGIRDQQRSLALRQPEIDARATLPSRTARSSLASNRTSTVPSGSQGGSEIRSAAEKVQPVNPRRARKGVISDEAERHENMHVGERQSGPSSRQSALQHSDASARHLPSPLHLQQSARNNSLSTVPQSSSSKPATYSAQFRAHARLHTPKDIIDITTHEHKQIGMEVDANPQQPTLSNVTLPPRPRAVNIPVRSIPAAHGLDPYPPARNAFEASVDEHFGMEEQILLPRTYQPDAEPVQAPLARPMKRRQGQPRQEQEENDAEQKEEAKAGPRKYAPPEMYRSKVPRESIWENERWAFFQDESANRRRSAGEVGRGVDSDSGFVGFDRRQEMHIVSDTEDEDEDEKDVDGPKTNISTNF